MPPPFFILNKMCICSAKETEREEDTEAEEDEYYPEEDKEFCFMFLYTKQGS